MNIKQKENYLSGVKTSTTRTLTALATIILSVTGVPVVAQDTLEEVVVTAQRREQSLQDVPISINAFSNEDIQANMFEDVADYVTRTPNISWASTGSRSRRELSIRGTTNFLNVNSTLRSNTFAFYEDDFSIGGSSGNPPLMDIERIEILRGPQATYFGRNAMGGGISVTTRKPNAEKIEGSIMADYGNFDTKEVEGVINVPVIKDVLALRGNIRWFETDGNIKNIQPDLDGNSEENKYARLAARWTPNADLTVDIVASVGSEVVNMREGVASGVLSFFGERLFGSDTRNEPDADGNGFREGLVDTVGFWPNNRDQTNFGDPQEVGLNYRQIVGRVDYAWNDLLFTSITGHIDSNFFLNGDIDGVSLNQFQEYRDIKRDSVSQEFRIQNTDDSRMRWSLGVIWAKDNGLFDSETFNGDESFFAGLGLPGGTGGEQVNQGFNFPNNNLDESIEALAIFGQFDFDFTDRLTLSVGGRWAEEDSTYREIDDTGVRVIDVDTKFKSFSPRFAVNYAATENINLYGTISKGFKSGGVTGLTNTSVPYEPEIVWNYEMGVKGTMFDNRLRFSAAAFVMDWTDMQVEFLVPVLATGATGGSFISNAEKATSKGVELSLTALPLDNLVVNFNLGYLRAKLNRATIFIRDNQCDHVPPSTECNHVLDGATTPLSPKWTASADGEYTFPVMGQYEGFGRLEWVFRDTVDRTLVEGLIHPDTFPWKVPAYNFFNLRAGIRNDTWSVTAYAENLFDNHFYQNAYVKAWASGVALEPSMQSYGIRVRYNYGASD